jgi:hypothetical protein
MSSTNSQLLLANRQPPPVNMETYTGSDDDFFLARRGALRKPSPQYTPVFNLTPTVGPPPRLIRGLIDSELDNLVRTAFDCDDCDNTFRGMLRAAIDAIQPDVLTSLCAYRIGFEDDFCTELTMLVTVLPGSLTTSEAIQAIGDLLAVLEK